MGLPVVVAAAYEEANDKAHAVLVTLMSCCDLSFEEADQLMFDAMTNNADRMLPARELRAQIKTLPVHDGTLAPATQLQPYRGP